MSLKGQYEFSKYCKISKISHRMRLLLSFSAGSLFKKLIKKAKIVEKHDQYPLKNCLTMKKNQLYKTVNNMIPKRKLHHIYFTSYEFL